MVVIDVNILRGNSNFGQLLEVTLHKYGSIGLELGSSHKIRAAFATNMGTACHSWSSPRQE